MNNIVNNLEAVLEEITTLKEQEVRNMDFKQAAEWRDVGDMVKAVKERVRRIQREGEIKKVDCDI